MVIEKHCQGNAREVAGRMAIFGRSEPVEEFEGKGIYIGRGLIYKSPIIIRFDKLINPHVSIIGMSGAGKSYLLKSMIIRRRILEGINIFAMDWNGEYNDTIEFLSGTPHKIGIGCKIGMNFLRDKNKTLDCIAESVSHAIGMEANDSKAIRQSVQEVLERGNGREEMAKEKLRDEKILSQIERLHLQKFFSEVGCKIEELLNGASSIDLSSMENDMQREIIVHFILQSLVEHMHGLKVNGKSKLMFILDEAWRSINDRQLLHRIYREGRKYGIGVVTATQHASDIDDGILASSACIFIFKMQGGGLGTLAEKGFIGKKEAETLESSGVGKCAIRLSYKNGTAKPFFVDKVDGFLVGVARLNYGGNMHMEIPFEQIENIAKRLGLSQKQSEDIRAMAEEAEGEIDIVEFIRKLLSIGLDRPTVISFFRLLGLNDIAIVRAYENAKGHKQLLK
ncbi:MAG: ATP-binding protein [Candidatus Micrarchaeia archaeon]